MAGGGAKAEPEEELSSSSGGGSSENWERSEEGVTKSKNKVLPDGFLDPLPRQKSAKLQRFSNEMALRGAKGEPHKQGMVIKDIPPLASTNLCVDAARRTHRATHPDDVKMAFGDELPHKSIKNIFVRPKKVNGSPSSVARPSVGASSSHIATQTQPSPTLPTPPAGSQFYSPDLRFPLPYPMHCTFFYPYYPPSSQGVPSTYPYSLYTQPFYYPSPPLPFPGGPFTFMKQRPETTSSPTTNGRMLIKPEGDTFHPSEKPTHKIEDIIRSKFDAPYVSWKKIPQEVRDIWFKEFERDFYWLPQHNAKIRKNFEKRGSTLLRDMFTYIRKSGERALWISESVWDELTRIWASLDDSKRRDQNKMNRASDIRGMGNALHSGGSVPHTKNRRRLKEILGKKPTVDALNTRTHQRREDQQWVDHRTRRAFEEYTRLRESHNVASEGSSAASTNCSDYNIWSQEVGRMHKGRVYGLDSRAHAFEGQASGSSRISASNQEGLVSQQVTALTTELEQVRKSQKVMQMQQSRMLEELHKIREQFCEKQTAETEE
ncbi:uncharacterized protein LOC110102576 [Dendrobium catenatum]|uniref:uncharacterized protein LOC110102576 n=1 Tax=Dendrobium catenatum TaxID=906689 RepID=UPI0009F4897B|nr:uncharacterized protein LOC110102576 [Dendrobium catenatum]